eukprot:TRINITY_DN115521_c0_g1_i1.p1 TRINITY_DN115521_c0_g1~~TRINITY_DN115521_c0_g1_i1.p1  ORF type:complete len:265 (+),score=11.89 TRINITY_DN115521_c0_g1_i1:69-863(+)
MHSGVSCMIGILLLGTCIQPVLMAMLTVFVVKHSPPPLLAPTEASTLRHLVLAALGCAATWLAWAFAYGQRRCCQHLLHTRSPEKKEKGILSVLILTECICVYGTLLALGLFAIKYGQQQEHTTVASVQQNWAKLAQQDSSYLCRLQEEYHCSGWSENCTVASDHCPVACQYNENPTPCVQTHMFRDLREVWKMIPKWGIVFTTIAGVFIVFVVVVCICCLITISVGKILQLCGCINHVEEGTPLLALTETNPSQANAQWLAPF